MRKALSVAILLALLPLGLRAQEQEIPSVELFKGYSYLRADGGKGLHGWNMSLALNLNRYNWLGLVFEASGHYGFEPLRAPGTDRPFIDTDTIIHAHTAMAGPRLSYRKSERITPFAQALVGIAFSNVGDRVSLPGSSVSFPDLDSSLATAVGGGLDVKLSDRFALRAIHADYLLTRSSDRTLDNARVSAGLVIRFY